MSPGGPTPAPHCGLLPHLSTPCEGVNPCPLSKLAAVAASLHPSSINNGIQSTQTQLSIHPQMNLVAVRFILQKPRHALAWGMSLSMIHSNFLIVGYVDCTLMHQYTVVASYDEPFHQGQYCSVPQLRPGDVIFSINGRPIASFPSFLKITELLKNSSYLWITAMRPSDLSQHIRANTKPQLSYWAAEETYRLLKPQLLRLVTRERANSFPMKKGEPYEINKLASNRLPAKPAPKQTALMPVLFTNPLFRDDSGQPLPYADDLEFDPEDGSRATYFVAPMDCFHSWLASRKTTWRHQWTARPFTEVVDDVEDDAPTTVPHDFWSHQGFASFDQWQASRIAAWKRQYSWNLRKRKRIEEEAEEIVHFPCASHGKDGDTTNWDDNDNDDDVDAAPTNMEQKWLDWLRVRKNQWKILRRTRQRKLEQTTHDTALVAGYPPSHVNGCISQNLTAMTTACSANPLLVRRRQTTGDMLLIDSLLEEKESKRQANVKTFDLAFVFDATLGAPDDVIAQCLRYLPPSEHGKLLCINATTSCAIKQRDDMWRQLCPSHWILPRRPRKRWHDLYLSKIRQEADVSRKRSDDLLSTIASVLFKGDHMQKVEKLVTDGEHKFAFDVNYASGVVCERNSILNLAVIHGRYKVVRWLVDTKGSNVESSDRGGFTPLLNAAWAGNIRLVRFLLSHGCDRTIVGRGHYTKPLAAPDFKGHTAEGWARERSFPEIAELLRLGL